MITINHSAKFKQLNSVRSYTECRVVKIFDFSATNNIINLEKRSELEDTHMSENYRLRTYTREKGGTKKKILWNSIHYCVFIISLYLE